MTENVERWYARTCAWGFVPVHCLAAAFGMAVLAGSVCALGMADGWPTGMAAHLALAHAGVIPDATVYHPVWGWCVRLFGLHAEWLSVLSAGTAAGLLAFCAARAKNVVTGVVAGFLFASSPWFLASGANVAFAAFDLMLVLLAVALVPIIGEPGGWWRWPLAIVGLCLFVFDMLRATLAHPAELLLEGLVATAAVAILLGWMAAAALETRKRLAAYALFGVVAAALVLMPTLTVFSDACGGRRLAHRIAGVVLDRGGAKAKWIIADGTLDDALAYHLAKTGNGPHLVSLAHDHDSHFASNLVQWVEREHPQNTSLRLAAKLGVVPFLEELPFVETNAAVLVSVWGARTWDAQTIERTREWISASGSARRDPLRPYVESRLACLSAHPDENKRRAALHLLAAHLGDPSNTAKGDTNLISKINATVDQIAADARCGNGEKLQAHARQLVRIDRTNPLGNALLGTFAASEGDDEMAVLCLARAVKRGAAPVLVWNDYAEALRRVGRYDEAEKAIRRALAKEPGEWRLYETLADVLFSSGAPLQQVEEPLVRAEKLSARIPTERKPTLAFLRAAMTWRKGERGAARIQFKRLAATPLSPYLKTRIAQFR